MLQPGLIISGMEGPLADMVTSTRNRKINSISIRPKRHYTRSQVIGDDKRKDCKNFKEADKIYQGFDYETRRVWAGAVKIGCKSSYDIWMMECMT